MNLFYCMFCFSGGIISICLVGYIGFINQINKAIKPINILIQKTLINPKELKQILVLLNLLVIFMVLCFIDCIIKQKKCFISLLGYSWFS